MSDQKQTKDFLDEMRSIVEFWTKDCLKDATISPHLSEEILYKDSQEKYTSTTITQLEDQENQAGSNNQQEAC